MDLTQNVNDIGGEIRSVTDSLGQSVSKDSIEPPAPDSGKTPE
jgi:hypothetical protein